MKTQTAAHDSAVALLAKVDADLANQNGLLVDRRAKLEELRQGEESGPSALATYEEKPGPSAADVAREISAIRERLDIATKARQEAVRRIEATRRDLTRTRIEGKRPELNAIGAKFKAIALQLNDAFAELRAWEAQFPEADHSMVFPNADAVALVGPRCGRLEFSNWVADFAKHY